MGETSLIGPLAWYQANSDVMVFCLLIGFVASGITIFLKNARGSSVAVAFLSSLLFISLGVPFLSVQYKWAWTSLAIFAAMSGFGSLTLAWSLMRTATGLQGVAEKGAISWANSIVRRATGGTDSPPSQPPIGGSTAEEKP